MFFNKNYDILYLSNIFKRVKYMKSKKIINVKKISDTELKNISGGSPSNSGKPKSSVFQCVASLFHNC